jgi:Na+-translocating ferredoxin:NAD+ oxidoreductase subunit B
MSYTITEVCNGCGACKKICPANAISGASKKIHKIEDELCIECGACGKVCPKEAVKDSSGRVCVMVKKSEWEKPVIELKKCNSCVICIDTCPTNCLAMSGAMGLDKHAKPYINDDKACIGCGFCAVECPVDAITMVKPAPKAN